MPLSVSDLPGLTLDAVAALPAADTVVLTVNNRLARRLVAELAARLGDGRRAAELARIMPLSAWLRHVADAHAFLPDADVAGRRLDGFAARWLWAQVISQAEADRPLLDVAQAAALAADADSQIDEWMLSVPPALETPEYQRLAVWRRAYRDALERAGAEDENTGYENVLRRLDAGAPPGMRHLVLAGFGEISPRLARLLDVLRRASVTTARLLDEGEAASPVCLRAADRYAEWQAAAAWAAERLRADPKGRYAIVAAQLQQDAPLARRYLARMLAAGSQGPALPFNVAVGRPLSEWPAVRAALAWLSVLVKFAEDRACPVPMVGAALLAGHCAGDVDEAGVHAGLDAKWRRRQRVVLALTEWMRELERCPRLAAGWRKAWQAWGGSQEEAPADAWGRRFRAALAALGFPGDRALDSAGYQVCEAFEAALDRYAGMTVVGKLDASQAVSLLADLAADTLFQPQRDPGARLDVLGLLEAEGGRWDGVWVLGLSDEVLPATPKPNPLLPLAVLRRAGAPRATPERERQWAQELFASLCRCAPQVVFSHPQFDGERALRPAPMIAALPAMLAPQPPAAPQPVPMESLRDEQGLPLAADRPTVGGLDVLDTQSRNPMWAYVRHRLGARALPDYAEPATTSARGQFLHAALEAIWRDLRDQETLHEYLRSGRLPDFLRARVDAAADAHLRDYSPALRQLECERACSVLATWLDVEAQRTPFAVEQLEYERAWQHGPLTLNLRLDRVDRLADGSVLIVDYKTGMGLASPESDWTRERPVNLQLPFYAAVLGAGEQAVCGLVLARVHARHADAAGLADVDVGLPGVDAPQDWEAFRDTDWGGVLQRWRRAVQALADEYAAGVATNAAMRRDDLKYCDALPFLRLEQEVGDD